MTGERKSWRLRRTLSFVLALPLPAGAQNFPYITLPNDLDEKTLCPVNHPGSEKLGRPGRGLPQPHAPTLTFPSSQPRLPEQNQLILFLAQSTSCSLPGVSSKSSPAYRNTLFLFRDIASFEDPPLLDVLVLLLLDLRLACSCPGTVGEEQSLGTLF